MTQHAQISQAECPICGCSPCASRTFCKSCGAVDRKAAARRQHDHDLPRDWDTMSVCALWDSLNDPRRHSIPKSIVDTFHFLIKQNDAARMRAWLAQRTPEERIALRKLIEQ